MEIKYSQESDVLMVHVSDESVDHAEESDGVIAHFSKEGRPVLFEIQGGREFLLAAMTSLVRSGEVQLT